MKEFHLPRITAEQVHFVAGKTRKLGVGVSVGGLIVGELPLAIGATVGWGLSAAADELAIRRIRQHLRSGQESDLPKPEAN